MTRILKAIGKSLILPREISEFERAHLEKTNHVAMWFFWAHVPVFALIAYFNDTGPVLAAVLTAVIAAGPWFAFRFLKNPRTVTLVYGFAAMLMGGMLVHIGQGPVQIEMHFYFFALLAMLAVFGNPQAVVVAAVTVAVHHLVLWVFLPASIFNYDAAWWVVAVHAAFVVLEASAGVYIARSFFDNVIGLEKIIQARTVELDERNAAMRLVLNHIDQGLVTIDRDGLIQPEYSAAFSKWFGTPPPDTTFSTYISDVNPHFGDAFDLAFEQCLDGFMPIEVTIDQAPSLLTVDEQFFRVRYIPLLDDNGDLTSLLLVIADVTAEVTKERLEVEQRETINILDRASCDLEGFMEFTKEAANLVESIVSESEFEPATHRAHLVGRAVHTLKGNAMLFGAHTLADQCHEIETTILIDDSLPTPEHRRNLSEAWASFSGRVKSILGESGSGLHLSEQQFRDLLLAAVERRSHEEIASMIEELKMEPTRKRLARLADQAESIADRLNKPGLEVAIEDENLSLDPAHWSSFWSAFVHLLRNAIDHGLPKAGGDKTANRVLLRTEVAEDEFVISIEDNGRGIDWDLVREKASTSGLPAETRADLISALLAEGFTTASEVTAFSGRGVGLAAVRTECEAREGRVEVRSAPGQGTVFAFHFSTEQMRPMAANSNEVPTAPVELPRVS